MKLKFKLNGAAIKALAIQHGEKAGFFLGVLVLVFFIWSAIKTDLLGPEKQPLKLEAAAKMTDDHITNSKWDPKAKGIEVVDYVARAKRDPLNDKDYRVANSMNPPLWDKKGKRPEPKLLPVEEMLATAGLGIFALAKDEEPNAAGGPRPPVGRGPRGPQPGIPGAPGPKPGKAGDKPQPGAAPKIPRQPNRQDDVVVKGVRPNNSTDLKGFSWVVITGLIPGRKQELEFEESFRNVIKPQPETDVPEYLGLKIERAEIKDDAAAPRWQEIKLKDIKSFRSRWQAEAHEVVDDLYIDPMYTMPLAPLVGADWEPAAVSHPKVKLLEKAAVQTRKVPVEETEEDEDAAEGIGGKPNRPDRFGAPVAQIQRDRRTPRPGGAPVRRQADVTLFRFLDATVEPGKKYRYRVQLRLSNPNHDVTERYLKNPESSKQKFLYTPWSEPTPLVTIPRDVEVFAGHVVKPSTKEPSMKAMVTKLDREHGLKLVADETFQRGSLINIRKKVEIQPLSGNAEPEKIDALLNSDSVIVDIEGGKPLKGSKSLTEPGEMVILQPDGSLVVRDELDDELSYKENLPPEAPKSHADDGDVLPGDPYGKMKKSDANVPKKSKLETLKEEAKAKKQNKKKRSK